MRTAIATKFVAWEVSSLENLQGSKVYGLRTKLNNGEKLSREEKDWLTRNVNSNTYFKSAVPLQGWMSLLYRVQDWGYPFARQL